MFGDFICFIWDFPCGSADKESTCSAGDLGSVSGLGRSPGEENRLPTPVFWPGEFHGLHSPLGHKESDATESLSLFLVAQRVKNPPAGQETPVQFFSRVDLLEKGKATHSRILGLPGGSDGKESTSLWEIRAPSLGSGRSPGGGHGNPLQYFCLENPHGQGSLRVQRVGRNWMTKHSTACFTTAVSAGLA